MTGEELDEHDWKIARVRQRYTIHTIVNNFERFLPYIDWRYVKVAASIGIENNFLVRVCIMQNERMPLNWIRKVRAAAEMGKREKKTRKTRMTRETIPAVFPSTSFPFQPFSLLFVLPVASLNCQLVYI